MPPVGRDRELEAIAAFLAVEQHPERILLLEGEAGIGKTTLWLSAVEKARRDGWRVLLTSSARAETQLSFTALRDLLGASFDEIADELPTPQRRSLAVALLLEPSGGSPPDPGATAVAFLTALRALAARAPTLVALDDVQWLDDASAAPLSYVARRLADEPIAFLLAGRPHPPPRALDLERLEASRVLELRVGPLSVGALGRLLHDRLGRTYSRPTLHRLHEVSGGNSFYAVELARALGSSSELLRPGFPLPVPESLRELVESRLAALPAETLDVLELASATARPSLSLLELALRSDPRPLLVPAVDAQMVHVTGDELRFEHPLLAAAVEDLCGPERRRAAHGRLAEVVVDLEERARHLALAAPGPDPAVARTVAEGARVAFARGSPATAAELASHAGRLTPANDRRAAGARRLDEIDYRFAAGDTDGAAALTATLLAEGPTGPERARLLSRQARFHHFGTDIGSSVALLYEALAEADGDDALRGEIEESLAWGLLLVRRDLGAAASHAASAARLAESRGDVQAQAESLATQALNEFVLGRDWDATMRRALALEESTRELRVLRHPSFAYGYCLSCADELTRARDLFDDLRLRATSQGDESSQPSLVNHLTLVEALAGTWRRALELADEGFERALESGQRPTQASILAKRALVEARSGRIDDAHETAVRALTLAGGTPASPEDAPERGGETAVWTLGFLALDAGDGAEAHRYLSPLCERLLAAGVREPGEVRCLPDEIEALILLGRLDEADVLLAHLDGWATRLQRPSALAAAARCRGQLHAERGETDDALAAHADAASWAARTELPFEHGRTLLTLGTVERRARRRRAARETLQQSLAIFDRLGARSWAAKARAELGRIGGRPPASDGLTAAEERVAALVAAGRTNKEVAAHLVLSVHTVEAALTSIYRKLDVRSRTELAGHLASTGSKD